jgi:two-component system alkaline phosphatase synthesis response regulator PhoP
MTTTSRARVLLVEDEPGLVLALGDRLRAADYELEVAETGPAGLERGRGGRFDAIILDVMLPGLSGFEVCKALRKDGIETPILFLTARGEVRDRIEGLNLGADDYLAKPFDTSELLARIDALLRRAQRGGVPRSVHDFDDVHVDLDRAVVTRAGEAVELSALEFRLLAYFLAHRGDLLPREELLEKVWGYRRDVVSRTVDQHLASLRRKLEADPAHPRYFVTVHGLGYRFDG